MVDQDILKTAMKTAVKSNLLFVDSARDYRFGKGPKQKGEKFAIMKAIYSRKRRKLNRLFALMKKVADRHDMTIPQVAIAFVANKGIVPICGCRKPYQVKQLGGCGKYKVERSGNEKIGKSCR